MLDKYEKSSYIFYIIIFKRSKSAEIGGSYELQTHDICLFCIFFQLCLFIAQGDFIMQKEYRCQKDSSDSERTIISGSFLLGYR